MTLPLADNAGSLFQLRIIAFWWFGPVMNRSQQCSDRVTLVFNIGHFEFIGPRPARLCTAHFLRQDDHPDNRAYLLCRGEAAAGEVPNGRQPHFSPHKDVTTASNTVAELCRHGTIRDLAPRCAWSQGAPRRTLGGGHMTRAFALSTGFPFRLCLCCHSVWPTSICTNANPPMRLFSTLDARCCGRMNATTDTTTHERV